MLVVILALLALAGRAEEDPRSTVRFRYACSNELGRRDVTLFANGTVRLRWGPWDEQEMYLEELGPEAVADKLRVLAEALADDDLDPLKQPIARGPRGSWVEQCEIELLLPDQEPFTYRFSRYDVTPLRISRMIHIAEELAQTTRPPQAASQVPEGYEPYPGDVLRNREGKRYRVLRLTTDDRGVELMGLDEPVRIYVARTALAGEFVAVEPANRPW